MSFLDILKGRESETESEQRLLSGKRIAILATDGFEQSELFDPKSILEDAGATTQIVSLKSGSIKAWNKDDWGKKIDVDLVITDAEAIHFDGLLIPGGVMNPDKLRQDARVITFVRNFVEAGKPIGAICHGPQVLIEVDAAIRGMSPGAVGMSANLVSEQEDSLTFLKGRTMTSYPSLKTDLLNAGATWIDEDVVTDGLLVTSRKPADIPAFAAKLIEVFAVGSDEITGRYAKRKDAFLNSSLSDSYLTDTRINDGDSDKLNSNGPDTSVNAESLRRPRPTYPQAPDSRL